MHGSFGCENCREERRGAKVREEAGRARRVEGEEGDSRGQGCGRTRGAVGMKAESECWAGCEGRRREHGGRRERLESDWHVWRPVVF
eukprot:1885673-Rhodomonas_salina.2